MSGFGRPALEAVLAAAARAPSPHNTQPWIVRGTPERITVSADPARWLRHGDPSRRDLHLSLGGFVEALRIACAANGVRADPAEANGADAGATTLALTPTGVPPTEADREAESLLRRRQTSRLRYAPREPEPAMLHALAQAARGAKLELHLVSRAAPERRDLDRWFYAAGREGWLDPRAVAELRSWLRIDPEGALQPEDGLSTHCLGLGLGQSTALAALVRPSIWRAAHATLLGPVLAGPLARAETRAFAEAPFAAVLVAPDDAGAHGAAFLRFWLAATGLGLALVPASALLDRRGWELGRHLGVAPARIVSAFRLGRSAPAPRSGRRAVARFATLEAPAWDGTRVA
jgi:nitroreductase